MNYTDPSGNEPECIVRCVPYDKLNLKKLSLAGRNLYLTYLKMWKKDGWWWDVYGDDGAFTIDEFMALNWHYEQANYGSLPEYNAAVQNAAAMWSATACKNAPYSCDLSTAEGSLNFLGYYSQVAPARAKRCAKSCDLNETFNYTEWERDSAAALVEAIHNTLPRTEFADSEWFAVGNVSMNKDVYRKMLLKGWIGKVVGGKDPMIILEYCQATFAWWAISEGRKNHTSPTTYLTGKNYSAFCDDL